MMALFSAFHPAGPFFVPLVMAYVALALAYLIGCRSSDRLTGLFAAALVALDPVFAMSAVQPMSDVPATCWLLAAICAVHTDNTPSPEGSPGARSLLRNMTAGMCAGMAVLTRPVLFLQCWCFCRSICSERNRAAHGLLPSPRRCFCCCRLG